MADVGIRITAVDDTRQAFGSINAGLGSIKTAAASVSTSLAAVGIGLSAGAFVAFARNVINSVDALNDLKDATGASVENISALQDIASRTGTSIDTVGTSLVKLNQALNAAKPGSDTEKAINAIGLSVKDLKQLDPAEAFQKIAIGLNGFADDANKARLVQELFGKSLKEIAPLLKDTAEAGKLVATVTKEQTDAAEALNKQFFNMQTNIGNAGRSLVNDLVPTLSVVAEEFSKSMTAADGFGKILGDGIKAAIETTSILIANVSFVLKGMGRELGAVAAQLVALGTLDIKGFNAISEAVKEDGIRARKELEDLERRIRMPSLADSSAGGGRGVGYGKFKIDRPSLGGGNSVDTAAVAAANRELAEQAKLIAELNGLSGSFQEDWARLSTLFKNGKLNLQDLTAAQAALLAKQPAVKAETDAQTEAQKAATKAMEDDLKARERYNDAFEKSADGVAKQLQALQDEEKALALAAASNITLAEAIAEVEIARLREAQAIELSYGNDTAAAAIQREIELRKELAKSINSKDAREANKKAAEDAAKEWQRGWEETDRIARDVFVNWDGSLKGLGDTLKKTLLSAIYDVTAKPIILDIYAAVTGGGGQSGQSGGGSSLFSSTGFAEGVSDGAVKLSNNLLKSNNEYAQKVGDYLGKNSEQIGAYAEKAGAVLNYLEAASNFKDGSYGKSIGQAAGQFFFGPIGGQIGKEIGSFVDKLFSKGEYVQSTGEAGTTFSASGAVLASQAVRNSGGTAGDASAAAFTQGLNKSYIDAAASLGIKAAQSFFYYGGNNSDGGKFRIGASVAGAGQVFDSQETSAKDGATKLAAQRAVFAALKASELPGYLAKVFDGVAASTATEEQINAALSYAGSLKQIRDALTETRTPLQVLQDSVNSAFAELGTSAETFKTDFVAAIDAGITPEQLSKFQTLGGNLEELAKTSGEASKAVAQASRSLADIANERTRLQDQLDELTLSNADLLAKQRSALDESNRALFDQVQTALAARDATDALAAAQAQAAATFADAMGGLSGSRFDLENQLLTLQGRTSEVASRTRSEDLKKLTQGLTDPDQIAKITASYDYNLSLQATIQSLQDATAAQEASSRASDEAARAAEQLKAAWQSVTDSIFDEVSRIRGFLGTPEQNFAAAQAKFSITAAQAASGDQSAAKALPELSKALLALAEQDATSLAELSFIQARTAGTLEEIGKKYAAQYGLQIPQFSVGTNYVPQDMLAVVHKGEAIIPAAYNPSAAGALATARLESLVEVLIARVEALEAPMSRTADATEDTAGTLDSATEGGNAMRSIVMEPIPV